jgi:chemotaxis protein methyltransferase CheR
VDDRQCVAFLQWALPRLGMRWPGFRKVRGQVCKRLRRRLGELGLADLDAYREFLEGHPEEWASLEGLTHITISRFYRDRGTFDLLLAEVLPALAAHALARGHECVKAWSAGCASGEEAYSLAILWRLGLDSPLGLRILATDIDESMLERARRGRYGAGSLRELPSPWRDAAFLRHDGEFCVREAFREAVSISRHDVGRDPAPGGGFDLVLCRNLAFTYFDTDRQRVVAARLAEALRSGGALVLGRHEMLPAGVGALFEDWSSAARVYRRC